MGRTSVPAGAVSEPTTVMEGDMTRSVLRLLPLLALCAWPAAVCAQDKAAGAADGEDSRHARSGVAEVRPYIEAAQGFSAQIEPTDASLTYTAVAAGVDATIAGRYSAASASVRYERRFGWDGNSQDGDTISGVARA